MRLFLFYLCWLIANTGYSQTTTPKKIWIVKGNGTAMIDIFTFPTLQFGVERQLRGRWSVSVEGGYQLWDEYKDSLVPHPYGFKAQAEIRYYLGKLFPNYAANELEGLYLGFQPFYRGSEFSTEIEYANENDTTFTRQNDGFGVKKMIYGANLLLGLQIPLGKRFIMDLQVGAGGMNRVVRNTAKRYNEATGDYLTGVDLVPYFRYLKLSESSGLYPNIVLFGFRLGYKFGGSD